MNESEQHIDDWIASSQDSGANQSTPAVLIKNVFMRIMNEIPISSQKPKEGCELFLQDAERNAPNLNRLRSRHFIYIGPGSEETSNYEKYADNSLGEWDQIAYGVTGMHRTQNHSVIKKDENFQKGELKEAHMCPSTEAQHVNT